MASDGGIPEDRDPNAAGPDTLSGRKVSHFRIGRLLGSGGMGEVYEAEDVRLGRSVALKFLAPELVRNPAAKARFLTEARAASALDHANLCTILDVGESEDGLLFLAMPRYDGESLQQRIARGPLPIDQAVDIAVQAARGLAKAHEHGIVHRDVKPANLFLTRDGVVKILDFGIAKLSGEVGSTRLGAILGTPSYMAPEQAGDDPIDGRADIWSLGVVLYEMLGGRRPFVGGTRVAVVYAAIHEEPEPLSRLRPEVPAELERVVFRMLAKDREQRYPSMVELLGDLRRSLGLLTTETLSTPAAAPARRRRAAFAGLALVAVAVLAGFLLWRSGGASAPQPRQIVQLTDFPGSETSPSLSPDGSFFVYSKAAGDHFDIFFQRVAGGSPMNLTASSPADDIQPALSPDGQQIAFRSGRDGGGIFLMGATGESVRRLTDFGFNPAWSPDGREIVVATEGAFDPTARLTRSQIFRVNVATGARRSLEVPDGVQPSWSPHGLRIAYWGVAQPGFRRAIWTIPADGGAPVTVIEDELYNWSPVWSPDGELLYYASNRGGSMNLWRVPIDERTGRVKGEPQPITTPSEWSALPSLSRDGRRLIYATSSSRSVVELVPFDPAAARPGGPPVIAHQGARSVRSCDISPDGGWLVLRASSPADDLLLVRSDGSEPSRQLTNDLARDRTPQWSPDGGRILFASDRSGKYQAWTIRPDGSGLTQVTDLPDQPVFFPFWSPDGGQIGFTYGSRGSALLDLRSPRASVRMLPPVEEGQLLAALSWSGDGRFLTGMLQQQDRTEVPGVILWSLADNTFRRLTSSGADPVFLRGGQGILFLQQGAVRLVDVADRRVRTVLSPPPHSMYVSARSGPGDRTLCAVRTAAEGDIWSLTLDEPGRP